MAASPMHPLLHTRTHTQTHTVLLLLKGGARRQCLQGGTQGGSARVSSSGGLTRQQKLETKRACVHACARACVQACRTRALPALAADCSSTPPTDRGDVLQHGGSARLLLLLQLEEAVFEEKAREDKAESCISGGAVL